jgi:mono/diheme cytochrome c family protein
MKRTVEIALLAGLACGMGFAQNVENGKKIFLRDGCYQCHGYNGQGTIAGARLGPPVLTVDGMIRYIRKPAGAMPAFGEAVLSDQEIRDIYAYMKTMPAPKPVKDIPLLQQMR